MATLLSATAALASPPDDVEVPVGDLLRRRPAVAPVEPVDGSPVPSGPRGIDLPLDREPEPSLVEREDLIRVVKALAGVEAELMESAPEPHLRVPEAGVPAVRAVLDRIRGQWIPTVDFHYAIEVVDGAKPKRVLAGREALATGMKRAFADAVESAVVADREPEVEDGVVRYAPVTVTRRLGAWLEVELRMLPGGRAAVLDIEGRLAEAVAGRPIVTGHPAIEALDRQAGADSSGRTRIRIAPGTPATVEWSAGPARRLRVVVEARWTIPRADAGDGIVLWADGMKAVGYVGGIVDPGPGADPDDPGPALAAMARRLRGAATPVRDLLQEIVERLEVPWLATDGGLIVLTGPKADAARDEFLAAADRLFEPVRLDVLVWDAPAGMALSKDGSPRTGGRAITRLSCDVVPDARPRVRDLQGQAFLADWDIDEFEGGWSADPVVNGLLVGTVLEFGIVRGEDGARPRLAVEAGLFRLDRMKAVPFPGRVPTQGPLRPALNIESPEIAAAEVVSEIPLPREGFGVFRQAPPSFVKPGREIVIVVRAR